MAKIRSIAVSGRRGKRYNPELEDIGAEIFKKKKRRPSRKKARRRRKREQIEKLVNRIINGQDCAISEAKQYEQALAICRKRHRFSNYGKYLRTQHWKIRRLRALKKADNKCNRCDSSIFLQVHHLSYDRLFAEEDRDLEVLCRSCHEKEHGIYQRK